MIGLRQAAAAALLAGLGVIPGAVAPHVSVYRQWRIVHHLNLKVRNEWSGSGNPLVAPSRDQAWALGITATSRGISGYFLEHWNGRRWRMTAVPGISLFPDGLAASGPDNVWLFGPNGREFVWDGQRWSRAAGTRGMTDYFPVVLGPSDVWTIGYNVCGQGSLDHWTGTSWSVVKLPQAVAGISGSSPRNLWVLTHPVTTTCGRVRGTPLRAYRWNGKSFRRVRIPRIVPGRGLESFAVSSPQDVWLSEWRESIIWHWNGHRWAKINVKAVGSYVAPAPIVPDGRGGAWIGGCWHWSRGVWHPIDYFITSCDETFGQARIPGTRSAWRLSIGTFGRYEEGTLEINGPLP